jgi:hypothetical protein
LTDAVTRTYHSTDTVTQTNHSTDAVTQRIIRPTPSPEHIIRLPPSPKHTIRLTPSSKPIIRPAPSPKLIIQLTLSPNTQHSTDAVTLIDETNMPTSNDWKLYFHDHGILTQVNYYWHKVRNCTHTLVRSTTFVGTAIDINMKVTIIKYKIWRINILIKQSINTYQTNIYLPISSTTSGASSSVKSTTSYSRTIGGS